MSDSSGCALSEPMPPATEALDATLRLLFPTAAVTRATRRQLTARSATAHRFAAVPNLRAPRLLVPTRPRASAAGLARYSAALSLRETWERLGLSAALRVVGTPLLPGGFVVSGGSQESIVDHLGRILGEEVLLSVGVGPVRANRKPVLGVFSPRGRPLAYAKVGDNEVAASHVRGEAAALEQLGDRRWRTLEVPRLLHSGTWNGMELLVCSALDSAPQLPRDPNRSVPVQQMNEIAAEFATGRCELADTPMVLRLRKVASEADGGLHDELGFALEELLERYGSVPVEVTAWHGDFTPWNVARGRGVLRLWDWERFDTGVPSGLDRVHWVANAHLRQHGLTAPGLTSELERAARNGLFDLPGLSGRDLATFYVAAIAARYLAAFTQPGGEVLGGTLRAVLGALVTMLGLPVPGADPEEPGARIP